ncbi:hypothetical protein [Acetobacterium wieringae]|uniref:Uncharacterized protein n=1 Tax=Acetobacterium wieringae TaxID=52694 RepID=A0A1F2PL20_9FIRM|nr:hypothetical protein [Acetobacterium wieringae]OFV72083.1 hypothetical protein ACWI_03330 [Acetobacterium wieringae]
MKINYKMLVAMLQEELIYVKNDLNTTMGDLETEERIKNALEDEVVKLFDANTAYIEEKAELEERVKELNADFFDLGDLLMAEIKKNEEKLPEQKLEEVVTGLDEFLQKQYDDRIDHLEALIFELGDDLDEQKAATKKTLTEMKKEAYDNGMAMEKLKKENKELKVAMAKSKEEAFEEDRKQIAEQIKKQRNQSRKRKAAPLANTCQSLRLNQRGKVR